MLIGHKKNGDPIFRYIYDSTQKFTFKLRQNINTYQTELIRESKMTLSEWLDHRLEHMASNAVPAVPLRGHCEGKRHLVDQPVFHLLVKATGLV